MDEFKEKTIYTESSMDILVEKLVEIMLMPFESIYSWLFFLIMFWLTVAVGIIGTLGVLFG